MKTVLDASAILSGRLSSLQGMEAYITPEVVQEIRKGRPHDILERLLDSGLIIASAPDRGPALDAARSTGDLPHLSDADISVIALAREISAVVITDDFRVQNVLNSLNLRFEPAGEIGDRSIKERWTWTFRCTGCKRYYEDARHDCPVCGSPLKSVRSRGSG
ncbi:MAG: DNA-binding protein [Candidatus Thermoplasmatota archaeon]|nr:DNA-binding protein [Candidatus Thermoplasmatota archaeon]